MHRNLTVHEVLYYQAMLRLPAGTSKRFINHKIRQVIFKRFASVDILRDDNKPLRREGITTTWKIQQELRRFKRRPCVGKLAASELCVYLE